MAMDDGFLSDNRATMTLHAVVVVVLFAVLGDTSCELYESGSVACLTPSNFSDIVLSSSNVWFVVFYAPWSGHCKHLAPAFKAAAQFFEDRRQKFNTSSESLPIYFGAVNGYAHEELRSRLDASGYPTIFIFGANKSSPARFEGPRTRRNLIRAAIKEYTSQQQGETPIPLESISDGLFNPSSIGEIFEESQFASAGLASGCPFTPPEAYAQPAHENKLHDASSMPLVLAVYRFVRGNSTENREFAKAFNSLVQRESEKPDGRGVFAALDLDEVYSDSVKELAVKLPFFRPYPPIVVEFHVRFEGNCFTSSRVHDSWRSFILSRSQ
jgi:thiol-disulfide isomerase/thioredoxin